MRPRRSADIFAPGERQSCARSVRSDRLSDSPTSRVGRRSGTPRRAMVRSSPRRDSSPTSSRSFAQDRVRCIGEALDGGDHRLEAAHVGRLRRPCPREPGQSYPATLNSFDRPGFTSRMAPTWWYCSKSESFLSGPTSIPVASIEKRLPRSPETASAGTPRGLVLLACGGYVPYPEQVEEGFANLDAQVVAGVGRLGLPVLAVLAQVLGERSGTGVTIGTPARSGSATRRVSPQACPAERPRSCQLRLTPAHAPRSARLATPRLQGPRQPAGHGRRSVRASRPTTRRSPWAASRVGGTSAKSTRR